MNNVPVIQDESCLRVIFLGVTVDKIRHLKQEWPTVQVGITGSTLGQTLFNPTKIKCNRAGGSFPKRDWGALTKING